MTWPLDKHLDRDQLDALLTHAAGLEDQQQSEAAGHVASCEGCALQLQMLRAMHNDLSSPGLPRPVPPGPECRGQGEWMSVAGGLMSIPEARELMKHASQCGHCGPLLKQAAAALAGEVTRREEALLSSLRSVHPDWQNRMARTLSDASQPTQTARRNSLAWLLPVWTLTAIACAAMAVYLGTRMLRGPSVDQLLAQAYTERRTLEVRIPHAQYAALRVERGGTVSNLEKPPSLLKAEALIGEKLQNYPNDPVWLDARARADLLDGNYDSAVKTLERALLAQSDSARLLTDLGSAYYMRGQSAGDDRDYGRAIEQYGHALVKDPKDPIALFNSALACEQFFLFDQAQDRWQQYLRQDPKGAWSEEARAHLDQVKQNLEKREHTHTELLLGPKSFRASPEVIADVEARPETYQDMALRSWLPKADSAPESSNDTRRALEILAEILKTHHDDPWLKDLLQSPTSPARTAAIQELLASGNAVNTGRYGEGIALAQQSVKHFTQARNQAGMLRAALAVMVAQDSALDYSGCLKTTSGMLPQLTKTRYRWLGAATFIEQGECQAGAAQLRQAMASNRRGWDLAQHAHYLELKLRATGFLASYLLNTGNTEGGLRELRSGLATFWQSNVSDKPGENLYSCLFDLSDGINWPFVDEFALQELLQQFPSNDPLDEAVKRQFLAGAEQRAGDDHAAQATLESAAAHLAGLPNDPAVALRKAEIAVDSAQIQLRGKDAQGAIASLLPFREQVETAGPGRSQAEYFKTLGEAYLLAGNDREAQPLLERALAVRETGLRSLQQETEKLAWSRGRGELYRDLLEVALKLKTPEEAMALWESYKGGGLRLATNSASAVATQDTALISYALLRESIIAFVVRNGEVHVHRLSRPLDLEQRVPRFLRLCADPSSDIHLLNDEGWQLYRVLVAPLESDISGARALRMEADGVLDQIPFGLLPRQGPLGGVERPAVSSFSEIYLGDRFEVTFSPGTSFGPRSETSPHPLSPGSPALVVVASGAADSSLAPLPGADQEGTEVAGLFRNAVLVSGRRVTQAEVLAQLRDAQIFHFAGHAFSGVDRVGLVLGPESLVSARDIADLQLRHLKLAVLSACETANGDEGTPADINSMARTLVAAGVPNVVASRWRVDSVITRQLMRAFYAGVISGKTPAESLRAAKAAVRSMPGYRHPYYWASFAVFGTS